MGLAPSFTTNKTKEVQTLDLEGVSLYERQKGDISVLQKCHPKITFLIPPNYLPLSVTMTISLYKSSDLSREKKEK